MQFSLSASEAMEVVPLGVSIVVNAVDFGVRKTQGQICVIPFIWLDWVTLGKLLNISKPQFLLKCGANNTLKNCSGPWLGSSVG